MIRKLYYILLFVYLSTNLIAQTWIVPPNNPKIKITGAKYSKMLNGYLVLQRHSDSVLALPRTVSQFNPIKAKTTTGIIISFKTNSEIIKMHFRKLPGTQRRGLFGIFRNGEFISDYTITPNSDSAIVFDAQNTEGINFFEITLPIMNNLAFGGIELSEGSDLTDFQPEEKKLYVAYGNSITHGVGQLGTHQTYPYLLAKRFNWELYNVAVGGGKTSAAIGAMLRNDFSKIDFITMLIGYNDYNSQGIDTNTYKQRYTETLDFIREKHRDTKIFCITPTFTLRTHSSTSGLPISDFRIALENLINQRIAEGDSNLFLIKGDKISSYANLHDSTTSNDPVHFTIEGAAMFADSLAEKITEILDSVTTSVGDNGFGLQETNNKSNLDFALYPNPTKSMINIKPNSKIEKIEIYNVLGENIKTVQKKDKIYLDGLASGVYFIKVSDVFGKVKMKKFVVN